MAAYGSRVPAPERGALEVSEEERRAEYEARWRQGGLAFLGGFTDLLIDPVANETAAEFIRERIRATATDPEVAERLIPDQVVGCKRLCVDTGYYDTYNRPNVTLVDLRKSPIEEITPAGIRTSEEEHELDVIVYATGFDAMTGALLRVDIRGRDGQALKDAWEAGPRTYLGLGVHGFPKLFTLTGPGTPSVLTNMMATIQQHVEWIAACMATLRSTGRGRTQALPAAQAAGVDKINMVGSFTLFPTCNSWYLGANVPGKTRVFMPLLGFPLYKEKCDQVAEAGYEGFALTS